MPGDIWVESQQADWLGAGFCTSHLIWGLGKVGGKGVASKSAFSFSNEDAEDIEGGFLAPGVEEWTGTQDGQKRENKENRPSCGPW